jgi:molybdopterin-biosynthesis enzyme MoeA-like protein
VQEGVPVKKKPSVEDEIKKLQLERKQDLAQSLWGSFDRAKLSESDLRIIVGYHKSQEAKEQAAAMLGKGKMRRTIKDKLLDQRIVMHHEATAKLKRERQARRRVEQKLKRKEEELEKMKADAVKVASIATALLGRARAAIEELAR